MPSKTKTLADEALAFALTQGRRRRCAVCALPDDVRKALEALRAAGHGPSIQSRWLIQKGYQVCRTSVSQHYLGGHDVEAA